MKYSYEFDWLPFASGTSVMAILGCMEAYEVTYLGFGVVKATYKLEIHLLESLECKNLLDCNFHNVQPHCVTFLRINLSTNC